LATARKTLRRKFSIPVFLPTLRRIAYRLRRQATHVVAGCSKPIPMTSLFTGSAAVHPLFRVNCSSERSRVTSITEHQVALDYLLELRG
jgi:hypothetical protein